MYYQILKRKDIPCMILKGQLVPMHFIKEDILFLLVLIYIIRKGVVVLTSIIKKAKLVPMYNKTMYTGSNI